MLANTDAGITCFAVPRYAPDGTRNPVRIQRLKDKLGNRSNASGEIEFDEVEFHPSWHNLMRVSVAEGGAGAAWADPRPGAHVARTAGGLAWQHTEAGHGCPITMTYAVIPALRHQPDLAAMYEPGRGVPTIIEMVNHTRLDCVAGSAAGMRWAVSLATHHAAYRSAFGKLLIEQPLMTNVLADLCVESEAATLSAMRLARAYDEQDHAFKRIATAALKYWVCKRTAPHAAEALEVLGGNGYVEESGLPRLYREAPLNSVWEGSGNVMCLDVLRALIKEPETGPALFAELEESAGADPRLDAHVERLRRELGDLTDIEARARRIVEAMALALQGSLVVRYSPREDAEAFCASRLAGDCGHAFGTLPSGIDFGAIVDRHRPVL
jgi:alkylation response protein AidB-like acyl-CoA dehydrogenase